MKDHLCCSECSELRGQTDQYGKGTLKVVLRSTAAYTTIQKIVSMCKLKLKKKIVINPCYCSTCVFIIAQLLSSALLSFSLIFFINYSYCQIAKFGSKSRST